MRGHFDGPSAREGLARLRPMNARVDHLLSEALTLDLDDRSALALALLDSVGDADGATASATWIEEIRRRRSDLACGKTTAVPWAEARARLTVL